MESIERYNSCTVCNLVKRCKDLASQVAELRQDLKAIAEKERLKDLKRQEELNKNKAAKQIGRIAVISETGQFYDAICQYTDQE